MATHGQRKAKARAKPLSGLQAVSRAEPGMTMSAPPAAAAARETAELAARLPQGGVGVAASAVSDGAAGAAAAAQLNLPGVNARGGVQKVQHHSEGVETSPAAAADGWAAAGGMVVGGGGGMQVLEVVSDTQIAAAAASAAAAAVAAAAEAAWAMLATAPADSVRPVEALGAANATAGAAAAVGPQMMDEAAPGSVLPAGELAAAVPICRAEAAGAPAAVFATVSPVAKGSVADGYAAATSAGDETSIGADPRRSEADNGGLINALPEGTMRPAALAAAAAGVQPLGPPVLAALAATDESVAGAATDHSLITSAPAPGNGTTPSTPSRTPTATAAAEEATAAAGEAAAAGPRAPVGGRPASSSLQQQLQQEQMALLRGQVQGMQRAYEQLHREGACKLAAAQSQLRQHQEMIKQLQHQLTTIEGAGEDGALNAEGMGIGGVLTGMQENGSPSSASSSSGRGISSHQQLSARVGSSSPLTPDVPFGKQAGIRGLSAAAGVQGGSAVQASSSGWAPSAAAAGVTAADQPATAGSISSSNISTSSFAAGGMGPGIPQVLPSVADGVVPAPRATPVVAAPAGFMGTGSTAAAAGKPSQHDVTQTGRGSAEGPTLCCEDAFSLVPVAGAGPGSFQGSNMAVPGETIPTGTAADTDQAAACAAAAAEGEALISIDAPSGSTSFRVSASSEPSFAVMAEREGEDLIRGPSSSSSIARPSSGGANLHQGSGSTGRSVMASSTGSSCANSSPQYQESRNVGILDVPIDEAGQQKQFAPGSLSEQPHALLSVPQPPLVDTAQILPSVAASSSSTASLLPLLDAMAGIQAGAGAAAAAAGAVAAIAAANTGAAAVAVASSLPTTSPSATLHPPSVIITSLPPLAATSSHNGSFGAASGLAGEASSGCSSPAGVLSGPLSGFVALPAYQAQVQAVTGLQGQVRGLMVQVKEAQAEVEGTQSLLQQERQVGGRRRMGTGVVQGKRVDGQKGRRSFAKGQERNGRGGGRGHVCEVGATVNGTGLMVPVKEAQAEVHRGYRVLEQDRQVGWGQEGMVVVLRITRGGRGGGKGEGGMGEMHGHVTE